MTCDINEWRRPTYMIVRVMAHCEQARVISCLLEITATITHNMPVNILAVFVVASKQWLFVSKYIGTSARAQRDRVATAAASQRTESSWRQSLAACARLDTKCDKIKIYKQCDSAGSKTSACRLLSLVA